MSAEPWRRSGTLVDIEDRNGQKNSCRFWTPFPYTRRSFNDAFYTHFRILVTIISIDVTLHGLCSCWCEVILPPILIRRARVW